MNNLCIKSYQRKVWEAKDVHIFILLGLSGGDNMQREVNNVHYRSHFSLLVLFCCFSSNDMMAMTALGGEVTENGTITLLPKSTE